MRLLMKITLDASNKEAMRLLMLTLLLATSTAQAQPEETTAHRIPFAAEGNTLALTVANTAEGEATAALVTIGEAPAWLAVTPAEVATGEIAPGEEAPAAFAFDVSPDAPVGEAAAVRFTITTTGGETFEKTVWLEVAAPAVFRLDGAYPNPSQGRTTFAYELPRESEVSLTVYDVLGRRVAEVVDGEQAAGRHTVPWSASGLASGLYLWRIEVEDAAGRRTEQRKLTLVR